MGQTRDLVKKIRDTKGTVHAKRGTIKDRNGMDLTEAEDIKKRWQEYTEELYKKALNDPYNHSGGVTHLHTTWLVHRRHLPSQSLDLGLRAEPHTPITQVAYMAR